MSIVFGKVSEFSQGNIKSCSILHILKKKCFYGICSFKFTLINQNQLLLLIKMGGQRMIRTMTIEDYKKVCNLWIHTAGMGLNITDDSREGIAKYLFRNSNIYYRNIRILIQIPEMKE